MSITHIGAWSARHHALHKKVGLSKFYYSASSAEAHINGDKYAIPVHRRWDAMGVLQANAKGWDERIVKLPPDFNGYIKAMNEPASTVQDNFTPAEAVAFVVSARLRWPHARLIGPNTVLRSGKRMANHFEKKRVVQGDWLEQFLDLWFSHGWPLIELSNTPNKMMKPFHAWGFHLYDVCQESESAAKSYVRYLHRLIRKPRQVIVSGEMRYIQMPFNQVWFTEVGDWRPHVIRQWVDDLNSSKTDMGKPLVHYIGWYKLYSKSGDYSMFKENNVITPYGEMVKDYLG